MKKTIEDFKPMIKILKNILNPGMKQRHWDLLANKTGTLSLQILHDRLLKIVQIFFRNKNHFIPIVDF